MKELYRDTPPTNPPVFLKQLAKEDYAYLQEKLHHYQRILHSKKRVIQRTTLLKSAANVVGYISEVSNETIARKRPITINKEN